MTDTPETDDATLRAIDIEGCGEFDAVHVQVAKRLERERNKAQEMADTMFAKHVDILDQTRNERDDLAAALNRACANPTTGNWYREAQDALAAWKERRKLQHQNTNQND